MSRALIGVGSNINPEENIRSGIRQLSAIGTVLAVSTVYESRAVGFVGDNFYNLAVMLETDHGASDLNHMLRQVEDRHGRQRDVPRYSSRTLDLDLLIYDALVCHNDELDIPRQDILSYAFVLRPLAEIAGEVKHPESGENLADIWYGFNAEDQELWPVNLDITV